ncbi:hypothetical protein RUM43_006355 [Polyplax serrata]|uniref:Uncharacterized protein n=1 Tax=Polyplax serrata TaxID=468196 RepID=A0AAN8RVC0_POLSC
MMEGERGNGARRNECRRNQGSEEKSQNVSGNAHFVWGFPESRKGKKDIILVGKSENIKRQAGRGGGRYGEGDLCCRSTSNSTLGYPGGILKLSTIGIPSEEGKKMAVKEIDGSHPSVGPGVNACEDRKVWKLYLVPRRSSWAEFLTQFPRKKTPRKTEINFTTCKVSRGATENRTEGCEGASVGRQRKPVAGTRVLG